MTEMAGRAKRCGREQAVSTVLQGASGMSNFAVTIELSQFCPALTRVEVPG
jgi:hypothetical protein